MSAGKRKTTRKKAASRTTTRLARRSSYLHREYERARKRVDRLQNRGAEAFDELWEEIDRIVTHDPPLYFGGGYRSLKEFIAAELPGETERSVKRNRLVARSFTPEDEARHGIAFLEEAARYARDVSGAAEFPPAIDLDRLFIPVPTKSRPTRRKNARDATVDEIRRARRALAGAPRRKEPPAEKALRTALRRSRKLRSASVRITADRVTLRDVPLSAVADLAKVLAAVKLPKS